MGSEDGRRLSVADLERRVADLEAKLEADEASAETESRGTASGKETSSGLSRRGVLGATGTIGLAGLFGASAPGAAQAAGSVGSPNNPVDLYAHAVHADRLGADLNADGHAISGVPQPEAADHAAPKSYVDAYGGGDGTVGWVNVVDDYGADPTGSEDSASAIQQAIDDAGDSGGRTVFLPEGTYLVDESIEVDASNSELTIRGVGYATEIRAASGHEDLMMRVQDKGNRIDHVTVENLHFDGNDREADHGIFVDTRHHDDATDLVLRDLWVHDCESSGVLVGHPRTLVTTLRTYRNGSHGLGYSFNDDEYDYAGSDESWPTPIRWRWANNVMAWSNGGSGIDISKQAGWCTNFLCWDNGFGMKFSNYGHGRALANGYVFENKGDGVRHTGGPNEHTVCIDKVWSIRNGQDPDHEDAVGDGVGFEIRNPEYQIGSIYAGRNADFGILMDDAASGVAQSIRVEGNADDGIYVQGGGSLDVVHLAGGNNDGDLVTNNGDMWVLRSRDYDAAEF